MVRLGSQGFVIRRGAQHDVSADVLTEPGAHVYEWSPLGAAPKLFASRDIAISFGRTMLASPFHVVPA